MCVLLSSTWTMCEKFHNYNVESMGPFGHTGIVDHLFDPKVWIETKAYIQ